MEAVRPTLPWEENISEDSYEGSSQTSPFGDAHDLMIAVLNHQMFAFNESVLKRIAVDSVDDEIAIQTFFKSVDKQTEGGFTRLLESYQAAAVHSLSAILQSLIAWRKRSMLDWTNWTELGCPHMDSRVQPLLDEKKINSTDYLYCRLVLIILPAWDAHNAPSDDVVLETVDAAFSSIKSLSRQKDLKEPEGIISNRRDVLDMFAHLIGMISQYRFVMVAERFYHELGVAIDGSHIPEATALLSGIRFLRLSTDSEQEIARVQQFLSSVGKQIVKKNKLELVAGSCQLFGDVLLPLTNCADNPQVPASAYSKFRESITERFYESKKLWKKLKEPTPALTMEVGILCVGKDEFLASQPFSVLERLSKLARVQDKNRAKILDCIYYLLMTMFMKYDNAAYDLDFDLILEKTAREIFPTPSKKLIAPNLECVDVYVDLGVLISIYRMDYAVKNLVRDCVAASESNHERVLVGMRILNCICDRMSLRFDRSHLAQPPSHSTTAYGHRQETLASRALSVAPVHLSSEAILRCRADLEQVLLLVDSHVGDCLQYNQPPDRRWTESDIIHLRFLPKEKHSFLLLLRECLECIRRIPPANIPVERLISLLSKYCFHLDSDVRLGARDLLLGLVKTKPLYRCVVVEIFATCLTSLPEGQPAYIHKAVQILIQLLAVWHDPVVMNTVDPEIDLFDVPGHFLTLFPADTLEACGLLLLCNYHPDIRESGYQLLRWTEKLNAGLPRETCDPTPRVFMLLEQNQKQILARIDTDPTFRAAGHSQSLLPSALSTLPAILVSSKSGELQTLVARTVGEIVLLIRTNCTKTLSRAFTLACERLPALHQSVLAAKRGDLPGLNELLMLWRNYCIVVGSSGSMGSDGITKIISALHSPVQSVRDATQYVLYYMNTPNIVIVCSQIVSEAKRKKDYLRVELAHVFRAICDKRVFESNDRQVISRCFEFLGETASFLPTLNDTQYAVQVSLAYDLFRACALFFEYVNKQLAKGPDSTLQVAGLREALLQRCMYYTGFGLFRADFAAWEARVKELCTTPGEREEVEHTVHCTQYWAIRSAKALLCQGVSEFADATLLSSTGPVFSFLTNVFDNAGQEGTHIAMASDLLKELIRHSPESQETLFGHCVDNVFTMSSHRVSKGYFVTLVDILTDNIDVTYELPVLLTLAMYKLADQSRRVRHHAVELLHWMSLRFFRTGQETYRLYRTTAVEPLYTLQMSRICSAFAEKHPELRLEFLREVIFRMGQVDRTGQKRFIEVVHAWFLGADLSDYSEDTLAEILQYLIVFTSVHGRARPDTLTALWDALTVVEGNMELIFAFMVRSQIQTQNEALLDILRVVLALLARRQTGPLVGLLLKELDLSDNIEVVPVPEGLATRKASSHWNFMEAFPCKEMQGQLLSHRGLAVVFLSDLVVEHSAALMAHVPELLHAAFVEMDSRQATVAQSAKVLLENVVQAHVYATSKEHSEADKALRKLLARIDESDPAPLWPYEGVTVQTYHVPSTDTLTAVAKIVLQALEDYPDLATRWAKIAIRWAVQDVDTHISARSLQLYRALQPALSSKVLHTIIAKLLHSIQVRSPVAVEVSLEIMTTLQAVAKSTPLATLQAMPQLFWTAVAVLHTVIPCEFENAVELTSALVDRMKIASEEMQRALLATLPQTWAPSFAGLSPLLLKGLCSPKTEEVSRRLLLKVAHLPCLQPLDGDVDARILNMLCGLMPYVLSSMGRDDTLALTASLSLGLAYMGAEGLSQLLANYAKFTPSAEGLRRFIHELADLLAQRFFPQHVLYVFGLLIELLENGPPANQRSILSLLHALLEQLDLKRSSLDHAHLCLLAPPTRFLDSEHWKEALAVMGVVLAKSSDHSKQQAYKSMPPRAALTDLQQGTPTWDRGVSITRLVTALEEVLNPHECPQPPALFVPAVPLQEAPALASRPDSASQDEPMLVVASPEKARKAQWTGIKPSLKREMSFQTERSVGLGFNRKADLSRVASLSDIPRGEPSDGESEETEEALLSSTPPARVPPPISAHPRGPPTIQMRGQPPSRPARPPPPSPQGPGEFKAPVPMIAEGGRGNMMNPPRGRAIRGPGPPTRGRGRKPPPS